MHTRQRPPPIRTLPRLLTIRWRNDSLSTSYTGTTYTHASPTSDLARHAIDALDTEPNALVEALVRYTQWQQRRIELRETRRKRKADLESAA
jgi:hypothetical protein